MSENKDENQTEEVIATSDIDKKENGDNKFIVTPDFDQSSVKMLGEGTYGRVCRVKMPDGKKYAVKINLFHEDDNWGDGIVNLIEYDILKRFSDHPLFLNFYGARNRDDEFITLVERKAIENISDDNSDHLFKRNDQQLDNIHFIMELGDYSLENLIDSQRSMTVDDVAKIICDILLGLEHMHNNNIIHRDLKPGNVIIFENDDDYIAKICDFGMAKHWTTQDENCQHVATYNTRSPELIKKDKYGPPSDVWTVGCILYEILFDECIISLNTEWNNQGEKVYRFDRRRALLCIMKYTHHNFDLERVNICLRSLGLKETPKLKKTPISKRVNDIDDEFFACNYTKKNMIKLLEGLLTYDQDERITATQALDSDFFKDLRDYIKEVRQHNVIYDMKGRDLKMVDCNMRNKLYAKIINKRNRKPSLYTTEERIDIHTIIIMERWIRAMYKNNPESVNDKQKDFNKYYLICRGVVQKLFNEGHTAQTAYINKLKEMEEQNGEDYFMGIEEELIFDILEYPYEETPYEIAHKKGIKVKGDFFKSLIEEMKRCVKDDEIMDMEKIVDKISKDNDKKEKRKKVIAPRTKVPRNKRR